MTVNALIPATVYDFAEDLQNALAYGGNALSLSDVVELIEQGKAQFWPGITSAIVTEIITYPNLKELHFFLAGGNLDELEAMLPPILQWGHEQGCTRATLSGRRGWERSFLKNTGWRPTLVIMEREI